MFLPMAIHDYLLLANIVPPTKTVTICGGIIAKRRQFSTLKYANSLILFQFVKIPLQILKLNESVTAHDNVGKTSINNV
jgi:hypothetical protein